MNNWKVKEPRQDLRFEIEFTKAYRDAVAAHQHPAEIELACLRAQYPAILMPIQEEDVLAGRIQMGLVGMGIQGQTGGTGYYIDEPRVTEALETQSGSAKYREDLHDLLTFWKGHCTYNVVLEETPAEIRRVIPTEQWKTQPVPASPIIRALSAAACVFPFSSSARPSRSASATTRWAFARASARAASMVSSTLWISRMASNDIPSPPSALHMVCRGGCPRTPRIFYFTQKTRRLTG